MIQARERRPHKEPVVEPGEDKVQVDLPCRCRPTFDLGQAPDWFRNLAEATAHAHADTENALGQTLTAELKKRSGRIWAGQRL